MIINFIIACIVLLSLACVVGMIYRLRQQPSVVVSTRDYCKLMGSGIVAFIADAIGIGSFAVNVALAKLLGTFKDEELPAINNGAQVVPGAIESLFFMQMIDVDITTLVTLVVGTCIGGLIGGSVVTRLSTQAIRLSMMCCFLLIIGLLLGHQFQLLPMTGDAMELHSWKLGLGFVAMVVCGGLTSVGIGLFALVQGVLFLLNVSPLVAFPIMTTAGAMQQPLTTLVFLQKNKIPMKKTLILSLGGCVGVAIILPIFKLFTTSWLHFLLMLILIYNFIAISRAYFRNKAQKAQALVANPT